MKWVSLARNTSRRARISSTRPHPRALVYRGPASLPGCPEAVADLLASSVWNFDVHFVGPDEKLQIDESTLHSAALYAQPGGGDLGSAFAHLRRHVPAIQHFVRSGGRYLGFCLGGYLAGRSPGFELLPGDADQYVATRSAEVHTTRSTVLEVDWSGQVEEMYFQDGPYFSLDRHYRRYYDCEASILARYRNGSIAALKIDYGQGRVAVVGPHPEADESWYRGDGLDAPEHPCHRPRAPSDQRGDDPMTGNDLVATSPTTPINTTRAAVSAPRLLGIDAARGIALFGMMAVHSLVAVGEDGSPTLPYSIAAGRSSALFAVLAGVGIAFTTGRARVQRGQRGVTAAALATRAGAVGAIGLLLGYTDAEYAVVILPYYAILFLLAIPLVFLPTRTLAALGVLIAIAVPAAIELVGSSLPTPSLDNPTLSAIIDSPGRWTIELLLNGEFPALPWAAYICAGIVIGRLRLTSANVAAALLVTGSAMAVGARILSEILIFHLGGLEHLVTGSKLPREDILDLISYGADGSVAGSSWWWLAVDGPHSSTPLDLLGTIGSSVAVIGAMLFLGHLAGTRLEKMTRLVIVPLAAAGSMTLTLYVLHIWFINSPYDTYEPWTGYILQVCAALSLGMFVKLTTGRGPLEAFVTMLANRSRRAVTERTSQSAAAHHH